LFLNWFLPKVLARECDKDEVAELIRSLVQSDIPALVQVSTAKLTQKNGKKYVFSFLFVAVIIIIVSLVRYNLGSLIEDFYCYLYHWHPRVFEWKNDLAAKHRLDYPVSLTEAKNYRLYESKAAPPSNLNALLLF
jgi:hypothetical protein